MEVWRLSMSSGGSRGLHEIDLCCMVTKEKTETDVEWL